MSLRFVTGLLFVTLLSLAPSAFLHGAPADPPSLLVPDTVNPEFAKQLDAYLVSAKAKDNSPEALETNLTALQKLTPVRLQVLQRIETANAAARKTAADVAAAKGAANEDAKKKAADAKTDVEKLERMYLTLTGALQDFHLRLLSALADARANREAKKAALEAAKKGTDAKATENAQNEDKKAQEEVAALEGLYSKWLDLLHADEPGSALEPPPVLLQGQPNPIFKSQLDNYLATARKASAESYAVALGKLKPVRVQLSHCLDEARLHKNKTKLDVDAAKRALKAAKRAKDAKKSGNDADLAAQLLEKEKKNAKDTTDADRTAQVRVTALEAMYSKLTGVLEEDKPTDLHLDSYAALVFSSLYRDPKVDSSYFAKSKSYFNLDLTQGVDDAGTWQVSGSIALQTTSFENAQSGKFVTTSGNFAAEGGLNYFPCPQIEFWFIKTSPCPNVKPLQLGLLFRIGAVGFGTESTSAEDLAGHANDEFGFRGRVGVILLQKSGDWRGSYSELSFLHDPLFQKQNRVYWRGRLVLTPKTVGGNGLGAFLEGSVNVGKGRDEVQVAVGIKVETLAVLRGITGGLTSGKPSD